ncbi:MAG TPA: gephyrin-like molybdotransferase Glp [Methylomirabilota bacterium]|nr:gephyrin-like molybdotransferase Glp [Methylomirabilota bacterium]
MAQLTDDCFAAGGPLMTLGSALDLLLARLVTVTESERLPLARCVGRILAAPVTAAIDVPPHDNSAVDGYAVYFEDLQAEGETRLPVSGRATAGHPLGRPAGRRAAVRIFTGAVMPAGENGAPGPDTVMMQEDCRLDGGDVVIRPGIKRGANRRRAGEDVRTGREILAAGARLRPQDVGLAASVGCTDLLLYRPLRVAVFSTGDELLEPGAAPALGKVYDSNRYTLRALVEQLGASVSDLGILADRGDAIRTALAEAAAAHDLLIASGGVSAGEEDHVKAAVEARGRLHFWRLAIKPGRPIAFGQVDAGGRPVPFIGLPGNPVAAMVTFLRIARPMILRLMGAKDLAPTLFPVRADFDHRKKRDRREWVRARLVPDGAGGLLARKFPRDGAGILSSLVEADGLVELPEGLTQLSAGSMVDFLPFSETR